MNAAAIFLPNDPELLELAAGYLRAKQRTPRMSINPMRPWFAATLMVGAAALGAQLLHSVVQPEGLGLFFIAAVASTVIYKQFWVAAYASLLSAVVWDFFFLPPIYSIGVYERDDAVVLALFVAVCMFRTWLAGLRPTLPRQQRVLEASERALQRVFDVVQGVGEPTARCLLRAIEPVERCAAAWFRW